jgi:hypothetical protein
MTLRERVEHIVTLRDPADPYAAPGTAGQTRSRARGGAAREVRRGRIRQSGPAQSLEEAIAAHRRDFGSLA